MEYIRIRIQILLLQIRIVAEVEAKWQTVFISKEFKLIYHHSILMVDFEKDLTWQILSFILHLMLLYSTVSCFCQGKIRAEMYPKKRARRS